MTMVPAQNLSKNQQQEQELQFDHFLRIGGYGGGGYCGGSSYINTTADCFGAAAVMSRLEGRAGGGGYDHYPCDATDPNCLSGSDHHHHHHHSNNPMAEDESRTNSLNNEAGAAGSSSREVEEEIKTEGGEWLQLSIGGRTRTNHDSVDPTTARRRGGPLIELDLLPGGITAAHQGRPLSAPIFHVPPPPPSPFPLHFTPPPPRPVAATNISVGPTNFSTPSSLFLQHQYPTAAAGSSAYYNYGSEMNWSFRPATGSSSSPSPSTSSFSSSMMMPLGYPSYSSYYSSRPNYNFQVHSSSTSGGGMDVGGPSLDFRVIDPPRRPHSGIWFMLQASQNQAKEALLPQISKSYLRIKDGRMTVSLLMKYLVNKLRLDSESEIEIRCRGQQLQPFLTMQHVRDNIWSPTLTATLLPDSSTSGDHHHHHHLMVLHYARTPHPHQAEEKVTLQ